MMGRKTNASLKEVFECLESGGTAWSYGNIELDFDWSCLPAWADESIALDSNGKWCSFTGSPVKRTRTWCLGTPGQWCFIGEDYYPKSYTGSWEESLHMNPKYKGEK